MLQESNSFLSWFWWHIALVMWPLKWLMRLAKIEQCFSMYVKNDHSHSSLFIFDGLNSSGISSGKQNCTGKLWGRDFSEVVKSIITSIWRTNIWSQRCGFFSWLFHCWWQQAPDALRHFHPVCFFPDVFLNICLLKLKRWWCNMVLIPIKYQIFVISEKWMMSLFLNYK